MIKHTQRVHAQWKDAMDRALEGTGLLAKFSGGGSYAEYEIEFEIPEQIFDLAFQFAIQMGLLQETSNYNQSNQFYEEFTQSTSDPGLPEPVQHQSNNPKEG
jgi:hypothetical protein